MGGGGLGAAAAVACARLIVPPGGIPACRRSSSARCACILSWLAFKSTSSNLVSCGRFLSLVAILSGNCILSVGCVIVSLIISS